MKWSPEQTAALDGVGQWLANPRRNPFFYLGGYAGTGKTTLAKYLAAGVERPVYAAYTGKAASVMRAAGCVGATTIHSLIYRPKEKSRVKLARLRADLAELLQGSARSATLHDRIAALRREIRAEEKQVARPAFDLGEGHDLRAADLLELDEVSMINGTVGEDVLSFGVPVLVLGDPAQLPPIRGGGFFTKREPDALLTKIHRQAEGNPIITAATAVRETGELPSPELGDPRFATTERGVLDIAWLLEQDQIIVGRNRTRHAINAAARKFLGHGGDLPREGERLVGLRNDHELGLLNGETYRVLADAEEGGQDTCLVTIQAEGNGVEPLTVEVWRWALRGEDRSALPWHARREAQELTYGYALTCHKAQGSQWPSVVVYDESAVFGAQTRRWLYTAITRASERLMVVR